MEHDWIVTVIAELKDYAIRHELSNLKIHFESLQLIAAHEIGLVARFEAELVCANGIFSAPKAPAFAQNVIAWPSRTSSTQSAKKGHVD